MSSSPIDAVTHVDINDTGRMRALAHPVRLRLLGILRMEGPATVGALAARVGEAAGSVSYHVQTLAKHGFVVEASDLARDRRERWWRAAHEFTHWDPVEFVGDPELRAASVEMRRVVLENYHRELLAALDAEAALAPEWIAASESSDAAAHLTVEELRQLSDELETVSAKWFAHGRSPREGTRLVRWMTHTFPRGIR